MEMPLVRLFEKVVVLSRDEKSIMIMGEISPFVRLRFLEMIGVGLCDKKISENY